MRLKLISLTVFRYPSCAESSPECLKRFPKKLKERLKCNAGVNPGWGLQLVEGWDFIKIGIIFVFFVIGSLLLGVLWARLHHSVQDAFTIASYIFTVMTASIGALQI